MTPLDPLLESNLSGTRRRFKWLRFWRYSAIVGLVAVVGVFLLGVALLRGVITTPTAAIAFVLVLLALALLAVPVIALVALVTRRSREWSASEVERVNPSLLDRLNTLVFLRSRRDEDPVLDAYGRRIERQAVRELLVAAEPFARSKTSVRRLWLFLLLLVAANFLFYNRFHPIEAMREHSVFERTLPEMPEAPLEAPIADAAELQEEKEEPAWGEVRITAPGRDLKVTKVDVVPLQIEAATSHPIGGASYFTALSGEEPLERELPKPDEPRFAVYKPFLYVDELRLSDWDVVTYYAGAVTSEEEYRSDIYFLEVRPFRQEIEKLEGEGGGGGSPGFNWMNQMTGLIDRQKHVLRQTHRFLARPARIEAVRRQDQAKLIQAESDLAEASRHLYAQMAAELENQAIGEVLDHLAAAEEILEEAVAALEAKPTTAPEPEQRALAELVATRKSMQKAISENPSLGQSEENRDDDPYPTADLPKELEQISEFRDEEKAAMELLEQMLEEQQEIREELTGGENGQQELAERQEDVGQQMKQFQEEHSRLAKETRDETRRAEAALDLAEEGLERFSPEMASALQDEAVQSLEELRDAVAEKTGQRQLEDAYKLKKMLDQQAREMAEMEKNPSEVTPEDAQQSAGACRSGSRQMQDMMQDSSPMSQMFGPQLHDALSDERQKKREQALDELAEAGDADARAKAAAKAREEIEALSEAFEESAPQIVQDLKKKDALRPNDSEALENAIRQLEALLGGQGGGQRSPSDQEAQRREALENLRQGLENLDGDPQEKSRFLQEMEETLEREEADVDQAKLRRLLERLQRLRSELLDVDVEEIEVDLAHIDPAQLPAEYRERIQEYFKKLSEER